MNSGIEQKHRYTMSGAMKWIGDQPGEEPGVTQGGWMR